MSLPINKFSQKLKRWFTLEDAVKVLNAKLNTEEFTINDLLQYYLDGYLNLSVIVHTYVYTYTCKMIPKPILKEKDGKFFLKEYSINGEEIEKNFSDYQEYIQYMFGYFERLENQCINNNRKLKSIKYKGKAEYFECDNLVCKQGGTIPFDFPLTDNNILEIKCLIYKNKGLKELTSNIDSQEGIYLSNFDNFYPIIRPLKKLEKLEINDPNNYEVLNKLPPEVELVIIKEEIERLEKLLVDNNNNNYTIDDYQRVLFSLKELVCSKAKKWSQDEINNELDNLLKGMSKRRLESMWSMLNKKYRS